MEMKIASKMGLEI